MRKLLIAAAVAALAFAGGAQAQQKISIGTGGTGGVYYPLGGGLANILSKELPNTQATAAFVKAYRARGGLAQLYAMSVNNDRDIVEALGPEGARGLGIAQVVPFPYSDVLPVTRSYRKALRQYGEGAAPTMTGIEGYLYGRVLVEALRRAGPAASRENLQKALDSGPFELGGHVIQFGPNRREGSNFVELTIIGPQGKLIR